MTYIERADRSQTVARVVLVTDDRELEDQLGSALASEGLGDAEVERPGDAGAVAGVPLAETAALTFLDLDSEQAGAPWAASLAEGPLVVLLSESALPRLTDSIAERASLWLRKPVSARELGLALRRLRGRSRPAETLYGSSPQIQGIRKQVLEVARAGTHVSVWGEPGVGKRIVARMLHRSGRRTDGPFLQISCAGFSEPVLAELLFGAPGGDSEGYLSEAGGGTLVVDDIDLLPRDLQERLLARLGGVGGRSIPTRSQPLIVAVSSRPLSDPVRSGAFLETLFDVLDQARIEIPPLRERKTDIPILADHFVRSGAARPRVSAGIEAAALAELMRYDWPGNVRELRDILEHARRSANGSQLGMSDLPALPEVAYGGGAGPHIPGSTIHEIERDAILRTLEATGGSTSRAARILEMSVRKIQYKLKEYRTGATPITTESRPAVAAPRRSGASRGTLVAGVGKRGD